ncbi:hypothetical protein [Nostoc flagelliforme]|uniref:hypothetical protein n=1 Tax=Nostoc flagelliforme TaxID=1306274 RepID=UPI001688B900|nr:hypothetical protein [Nostoc flagelliforme]
MVERSSLTLPEASLPELWGGEVGLVTDQMSTNRTQNDSKLAQLSNGIGQPDTLTTTILVETYYTRTPTESITLQTSSNNGTATQITVLAREQPTVKPLSTGNGSTITPVKSTTKHLTIPKLLGGVKSYDYLPPGWKNVEAIAYINRTFTKILYRVIHIKGYC